jgi:hypothetical protein
VTAESPPAAGGSAVEAGEAAASRRARHSLRDMLISLAVLVVPVMVIMFLARSCTSAASPTIDASNFYARASKSFAVVEPHPLPVGWRTVSAVLLKGSHQRQILRVGFAGPDGAVAQVVEDSPLNPKMVKEELAGGLKNSLGIEEIQGQTWERYPGRGGQLAFVSRRAGVILVLTGSGSAESLRQLAGSFS